MESRPVTKFALSAAILLTLTASVASVTAAPAPAPTAQRSGIAYTFDLTGSDLYNVNLATGATVFVGNTGVNIAGMSFHPDGTLYGIDAGNDKLVTIDTATGAIITSVNTTFGGFGSLAIDSSGNAFVVDNIAQVYRSLNLTTGAVPDLASGDPAVDITAMAFHPTSGTWYALSGQDKKTYTVSTADGTDTPLGTHGVAIGNSGAAFDASGTLYLISLNDNIYTVNQTTGLLENAVNVTNRTYLALAICDACPITTTTTTTNSSPDANLDTSNSPTTLTNGAAYHLNDTTGQVCVDSACNGGNHFQGDVQIYTKDGKICIIVPQGYEIVGDTCQDAGGRKDFIIQHSGGTNGAVNGAAVVADESAISAEAVSGYAMGATGGTFSCPVASGIVNVTVPANVVADGMRFLCAANENAQTASAPIGYSIVGSRVVLTTDTGLSTFDSALTICLSHTNADILKAGGAASNLRVGFFDGVMWQPLQVTSANANETCGMADHFTQFGLMAATPTALPATGASVAPIVWLVLAVVALAGGEFIWHRRQLTR